MKKLALSFVLALFSALTFGQTYPSPTYQGITIRGITGLQLDNGTSAASAYAGTSCTNQFPRSLNASGAATCSSVALTSDVSGTLPVASGGTACNAASGTCLDNITGFASTGFVTRTAAGTYAFQSLTNGITLGNLAQAAANTVIANATGSTANLAAFAMPSCSTSSSALNWTSGTGFTCGTVASSGANSNITSLSGLTTALSVAQGGTGRSTLTTHGVLVGEGTSAINQLTVGTTGQVLVGSTGADPAFGSTVGALTFTGAITPSSTAGIVGTTTNDNANAGSVGEYVSNNASGVSLSTAIYTNVTSISLTAGDWDVTGFVAFIPAGSTIIQAMVSGINTVSNTNPGSPNANTFSGFSLAAGAGWNFNLPTVRLSLSATTTVYLGAQANFTTSTCTVSGWIRARRVR